MKEKKESAVKAEPRVSEEREREKAKGKQEKKVRTLSSLFFDVLCAATEEAAAAAAAGLTTDSQAHNLSRSER